MNNTSTLIGTSFPKNTVESGTSITLPTTIGTLATQTSNCNHSFDVKLINGNYVSYCTKCGKIGDSYQAPMPNFTCNPRLEKVVVEHLDNIPCIDPLKFTCQGDVTLCAPNVDEAKNIKAWSTIDNN